MENSTITLWTDLVEGNIYMIDDDNRNPKEHNQHAYYYKYKIEKSDGNHMFVFERVNSPHLIFTCTVNTFYFNTGFKAKDPEITYSMDELKSLGYTMTRDEVMECLNCPQSSVTQYVQKGKISRLKSNKNQFYYNAEEVKNYKPFRELQYERYLKSLKTLAENKKNGKKPRKRKR